MSGNPVDRPPIALPLLPFSIIYNRCYAPHTQLFKLAAERPGCYAYRVRFGNFDFGSNGKPISIKHRLRILSAAATCTSQAPPSTALFSKNLKKYGLFGQERYPEPGCLEE